MTPASDVESDWGHHRVSQLATLINGFPFDSADFSSDAEVPLVRIRDLGTSEFETFVPRETVPPAAFVRDGDVVIGMDGDFNSVLWGRGEAALNQRVCLLRARPGVDPRYVAYAIPQHLQVINDLTWSTTVKHLSAGSVRAIRVPAHSWARQRAIADYLDRETAQIDAFIAKNEELIALLTERRAAAVEALVMGSSARADGFSSGSWRRLPIRAVATESRERNVGLGIESYLSLVAGRGVMPYAEKGDIGNKAPAEFDNCKVVRAGDVVINSMNYGIGSYGLSRFDGICSPVYVIVRPNTEIRGQLLEALLGVRAVRERVQSMGNGILAHRSAIGWAELKNLTFPVPPRAQQDRVVEEIKTLNNRFADQVLLARNSIALARERRAALISAAVTGKIDVGVAV